MSLVRVQPGSNQHVAPNGTRSVSTWDSPWCGPMARGDLVRIIGRKRKWTFFEYTTNDLGAEWVTVYGPTPGGQFTSVAPDRIRKVT